MLRIFKLLGAVFVVMGFIHVAMVIHMFSKNVWTERKTLSRVLQTFTSWMLSALNIKLKVSGDYSQLEGKLVVSNHMSYVDIFFLAALYPTSYVTSKEMRDTPILGWICRLASCVFVERRNKVNIQNEIQEITQGLKENLTITIFPEATSTNGDEVIRFRRPLFNAAIFAEADVQPICINYRYLGKRPVTKENRDKVCWYGDMNFGLHFLSFVMQPGLVVDIDFLQPIVFDPNRSLEALVEESHQAVKAAYDNFAPSAVKSKEMIAEPANPLNI